MATQALSQMNIRLDSGVKTAGDAVLAERGANPTTLVRALWQKIARGEADLRQVEEVLGLCSQDEAPEDAAMEKLTAMRHGRELFAEGLNSLGINPTRVASPLIDTDMDLYAEALAERMQERGL